MFTNLVHLVGRIVKPASVILLAVTVGNPTNAQAAVGRYESTGALGDLMPVGETVVFNTGGALPTVQIGTSASLTGRLQDDIAIYDFDSIVLPATVTVEITGPRPLVIAAAKDFFSAATFDVSGGRAGGGAGGSQGKSEASGGYGLLGAGYTSGVDGGLGGQGGYIYCDQTLGRYGMVGKSGYSGWKGSSGQSGSAGASGSSGFGFNYTIAGGSAGPGGSSGTAGRGGWGGAGGAPGDCNPLDGSGKAGGNGGVGGDGDPGGNGQNGGAGAAGYYYFPADTLDLVAGCGGGAGGGGGGGAGGSSGGSGGSGGGGGGGNGELWPGNRDGGHGAWSSRSGSGGESGDGGIGGLGGYGASGGGAIVLSARGLLKLGPTSVINVSASEPGLPTNGVPGTSGQSGDYGVGIQYSSPHYNRGGNSGAGGDGGRGGDGGTGGNGGPGGTGTAGMVKLQGSVIVTDGVIDATNYTDDTTPGVAAKITFISNLINNSVNSQNLSYVDTVVTGTVRNNEVLTTTSAYSNAIKVALMPTLDSGPSAAGFCMDDYFQEDKVVAQLLTQPPGVDLELIRLGGVFEGTDQVFLVNRSGGTLADRFLNINGHALEVPPVAPGKVWVVAVRSTDEAHLVGESGIGDFAIY